MQITYSGMLAPKPATPTREQITRLEQHMLGMPQMLVPTEHHFADALYAREIVIPKGGLLTGKVHKTTHMNVCFGDITVWTEDGMKRLTGFHRFVSRPGTKRVGFAHEQTIWITFHGTEQTDLERLEAELIESVSIEMENKEALCHG